MPLRIIASMQDHPVVKVADATIATAAVTYPWWRERLHEYSAIAADMAPFFGVAWLFIQILFFLVDRASGRKR